MNGCSLSILILCSIVSIGMVVLQTVALSMFPYNEFQSDQMNWSGILSIIEGATSVAAALISTVTALPYLSTKVVDKSPIRFATVYYGIFTLISVIVAMYRWSETGRLFDIGLCVRTEGDLVCPTVLYRTEFEIEKREDCKFNNFADSSSVWNTQTRVDWSSADVYSEKSRGYLFRAYSEARQTVEITEEEMTLYHDCWYWGCDPVCNERHDINELLCYGSLIASIAYMLLAVFSSVQSHEEYEEVLGEEPQASMSKGSSSGVSKSWNSSLRM